MNEGERNQMGYGHPPSFTPWGRTNGEACLFVKAGGAMRRSGRPMRPENGAIRRIGNFSDGLADVTPSSVSSATTRTEN